MQLLYNSFPQYSDYDMTGWFVFPVSKSASKPEKKGPGRPKKVRTGEEDATKGTFVADRQVIRKLKFIALVEDCLLKDVIDDAFKTYIEKWEKKNGEIPKPKR